MDIKIQSINIHALLQDQARLSGTPVLNRPLPTGLQSLVTPLLGGNYLILLTTNKAPEISESAFIFLLKISDDTLELEEKKEGKRRLFKLVFGSSFLSVNQRRAMGDDFKLFADRLKIIGVHLQEKPYKFWAKFLNNAHDAENKLQLVENSDLLSNKTSGVLIQLAQKIGRRSAGERASSTIAPVTLPELDLVKEMLFSILGSAQQVIITNSELVKNQDKTVYTFTITRQYARFLEKNAVIRNEWEIDFVGMKSILNQADFTASSADWLSRKLDSIAQDISANRAEMYSK
ncbi:hypothetical protein EBR57_02110 [bacterium]|nr:hypothetical protein [bacterium]